MEYQTLLFVVDLAKAAWVFALGACVGSLVNVLVYRLPRGLDVVKPASRCPSCGTLLTWRENIPVFGWVCLGGKCRFCRSPISPEYPIVEAVVGLLFSGVYLACYAEGGYFLGVNFGAMRPEWAAGGFATTWPIFTVILVLFACITAMTLVDAKTYQIPMVLTWVPAVVALVAHPAHAAWAAGTPFRGLFRTAPGWSWAIATPGATAWPWIGAAIGGAAGVAFANLFLWRGWITRSFLDYPAWEAGALARQQEETASRPASPSPAGEPPPTDLWIQYPHARREMLREVIFLAPVIGLALLGAGLATRLAGPWTWNGAANLPSVAAPLWLDVLAGVLLGYLVGGAVVWGVRILGSLAFGKEAMGLGDVHMLAAIGACLGWIDAVLVFFMATFVGVAWAVLGRVLGGGFRRAMPFGPFLGVATILVWFGKPLVERGLTILGGGARPFDFP